MTDDPRYWLSYEPETGVFRWRRSPHGRFPTGTIAGGIHHDGYRRIKVAGKNYKASRLAWLCAYGQWPECALDHINRIRHDDRLENLRLARPNQNCANCSIRSDNKTGYFGVYKRRNKWRAGISKNRRLIWLGTFKTAKEAALAYDESAKVLHGDFATLNFKNQTSQTEV